MFVLPAADGQPEVTAETTFTIVNLPVLGASVLLLVNGLALAAFWLARRHRGGYRLR